MKLSIPAITGPQKRIVNFTQWLIRPHASYTKEEQQARGRYFASITFVLFIIGVLAVVLLAIRPGGLLATFVYGFVTAATLFSYLLNRAGRYMLAVILLIGVQFVACALLITNSAEAKTTAITVIPILLASLFGGLWITLAVAATTIAKALLIAAIVPGNWDDLGFMIILLAAVTLLLMAQQSVRMRAERRLRQNVDALAKSEALNRMIIEASPYTALLLKALPGHVDFEIMEATSKAAEAFNQSPYQLIGKRFGEAAKDDPYLNGQLVICRDVMRAGYPRIETLTVADRDIELHLTPFGNLLVIVGLDVTQRRLTQEVELSKRRVDLLREFIADTTHDLMTPISIIRTGLYLIERRENLEGKSAAKLVEINEQVERLETMLKDMLHLSRLDTHLIDPTTLGKIDISNLLEEIVPNLRTLSNAKDQTLTLHTTSEPVYVLGTNDLASVFENLIRNAIIYVQDGGKIEVTVYRNGDKTMVDVADNGPGIEPHHLPHIFERFYRAESNRPTNKGGSGLGLAIAHKVVEGLSGNITVKSIVGEGTTFTVCLPVAK